MRQPTRYSRSRPGLWASALLLPALVGCATPELWDKCVAHRPADDPRLALFRCAARQDVLVRYDEAVGKQKKIERREFFLFANTNRLFAGKAPRFAKPGVTEGLSPIPVMRPGALVVNSVDSPSTHATTATNGWSFDLVLDGREAGAFVLPSYMATRDRTLCIVLTPLAVATDTAFVGACVFAVGAAGYTGP